MNELRLNVYDEEDNIIKTVEANVIDLRFGTIRSLMQLLDVESIENTSELLKMVYSSWNDITRILSKVFPDMEESDWDNVKLSELIPILVVTLKGSFVKLLNIPKDPKVRAE